MLQSHLRLEKLLRRPWSTHKPSHCFYARRTFSGNRSPHGSTEVVIHGHQSRIKGKFTSRGLMDPSGGENEEVTQDMLDIAKRVAKMLRNGDINEAVKTGYIREDEVAGLILDGRASHQPYFHPRTHNIPVALIHFRSYFHPLLDIATHFSTHAASALGIPCSRVVRLPTQRSLWTVPRGPFVHKKSQENFERKTHKRLIKAWDADQEVVDRWIAYMQMYPIAGVGMRIVRWHRAPMGIGGKHKMSQTVKIEGVTSRQKMEDVAAQIFKQEMAASANVEGISEADLLPYRRMQK
ncbi:ribosomal protein S10 [Rickenella mellea]|uniref:Small ribosomal subunit protein uS10m n=1 Tax=Rickenella mellea TaxID=50990 RepID=A0A4Y7PZJ9_9AGAM|nr:ribosomal protein S10 [Rickenella mellea]